MKFYRYFLAGLKRISRLFPEIFGLAVLFFALVILMGRILISRSDFETGKSKYCIGILVEGDNSLVDLGIYLLESFDDSKYLVEIKKFEDMDEAVESLYNNEISALCEIPEAFYDSINELSNDSSITYYTSTGTRGVTGVYMDAVTDIVSNCILYSEAGIFSLLDFMDYKGFPQRMAYEETDKIFLTYMGALVNRGDIVEIEELGVSNGITTYAYYFVGLALFFVTVLSFASISFFLGKNHMLEKLANATGISPIKQVFSDFCAYFICNAICVLILLIPVWIVLRMGLFEIKEFNYFSLAEFFRFVKDVYTAMLLLCAFEFLIFEFLEGTINKIIFSFVIILGSGYVSGLLYPKSFFPETIQRIGEVLPTGVSLSFLSAAVSGVEYEKNLLILLIYFVVVFALICVVRDKKIKK